MNSDECGCNGECAILRLLKKNICAPKVGSRIKPPQSFNANAGINNERVSRVKFCWSSENKGLLGRTPQ